MAWIYPKQITLLYWSGIESKTNACFVMAGSVAEWSKALVLGTSLFGGVGSNPTAAKHWF